MCSFVIFLTSNFCQNEIAQWHFLYNLHLWHQLLYLWSVLQPNPNVELLFHNPEGRVIQMSIFTRAFFIGGTDRRSIGAVQVIAPLSWGCGVLWEAGDIEPHAVLPCRPGPNAWEAAGVQSRAWQSENMSRRDRRARGEPLEERSFSEWLLML